MSERTVPGRVRICEIYAVVRGFKITVTKTNYITWELLRLLVFTFEAAVP